MVIGDRIGGLLTGLVRHRIGARGELFVNAVMNIRVP
jgi:hypothetical protein